MRWTHHDVALCGCRYSDTVCGWILRRLASDENKDALITNGNMNHSTATRPKRVGTSVQRHRNRHVGQRRLCHLAA